MNDMEALHRFEIFGFAASAATAEEADTIVVKLRSLQEQAAHASALPELLTRLEESERRFEDVRRLLTNAESGLREARRHATTDLTLPEATHA